MRGDSARALQTDKRRASWSFRLVFIYVFLPAAAICYALGRCGDHSRMRRLREYGQPRIRCECPYSNAVLIIFSLIFYAWGEPIYVALMIVSVFMNYVVGVFIDGGRHKSKPR